MHSHALSFHIPRKIRLLLLLRQIRLRIKVVDDSARERLGIQISWEIRVHLGEFHEMDGFLDRCIKARGNNTLSIVINLLQFGV